MLILSWKNIDGSSLYILRHIFWKLSNTSAEINVSLWTYESWYSSKFFILNSLQNLFVCLSLSRRNGFCNFFEVLYMAV